MDAHLEYDLRQPPNKGCTLVLRLIIPASFLNPLNQIPHHLLAFRLVENFVQQAFIELERFIFGADMFVKHPAARAVRAAVTRHDKGR